MKVVLDRQPGYAKSVRIIADEFVYNAADIDDRIKLLHIAKGWLSKPKPPPPPAVPAPKKKGSANGN